jgi:anti-sigma B factor antagonist
VIAKWHVVAAGGEVDLYAAPSLRESLLSAITAGHYFIALDFSQVTFIDSSGFAVIVGALKRLRAEGGELRIAGAVTSVRSAMRLSGLARIIALYPSVDEAVRDQVAADVGQASAGGTHA